MPESPEEKEALEKLDEATREESWREEKAIGGGNWWLSWLAWRRPKLDPPRGAPGLRDALHKDDRKS